MKTNGKQMKSGKVIQGKKISTDRIMIILFISISLCSTILFLFLHHYFYSPKAENKGTPKPISIQMVTQTTQCTHSPFTTDDLILFNEKLINTMGPPLEYNTWIEVLAQVSNYYPTAEGLCNEAHATFSYSRGYISTHIELPNKELPIISSLIKFIRVCDFVLREANSSLFEYKSFGGSIVHDDIIFTRLYFQHVYLHPLVDISTLILKTFASKIDSILEKAANNQTMKEPISNFYDKLLNVEKYMFLKINKNINTKENKGILIKNLIDGIKPLRSLAEMYRYFVVILMLEEDGENGSVKLNETIENELKLAMVNKGYIIVIKEKETETDKLTKLKEVKENIEKHCSGVFDHVDFTGVGEYKESYSLVGINCLEYLGRLMDYLIAL